MLKIRVVNQSDRAKTLLGVAAFAVLLLLSACATQTRRQSGAGGWYLMLPPFKQEEPMTDAPFTQWRQGAAFDSASECEAARKRVVDEAKADADAGRGEHHTAVFRGFLHSNCVSSADPRLKP